MVHAPVPMQDRPIAAMFLPRCEFAQWTSRATRDEIVSALMMVYKVLRAFVRGGFGWIAFIRRTAPPSCLTSQYAAR